MRIPLGVRLRAATNVLLGRSETFGPWDSGRGWSIVQGASPSPVERNGKAVRVNGFERHPVVSACIRTIVDHVAGVPIEIYRKTSSGDVTVLPTGNPAAMVLEAPRVAWSGYRLRAFLAFQYLTYGNALVEMTRDARGGPPTGLRPVPFEKLVHVYLDAETEEILRYVWADRFGRTHTTDAIDMLHCCDLISDDGVFGFPRAAAALLDISTDQEASQYVRQLVTNDGAPGIGVLIDPSVGAITQEQLDTMERRWREKMVTRGHRGSARFLAGVKDLKPIGFNLKDLEFPALRGVTREDICAVFGVDPRMIGIASAKGNEGGLSGVQYREARFRLVQQTVVPITKAIESQLDLWFCPEYGDVYARWSPEGFAELVEDIKETSTRVLAEMTAGARTREEARRELGLPDAMTPTDTLVGTISRIEYPVAMATAASAAKLAPDPASDPATGDPEDGGDGSQDPQAAPEAEPDDQAPEGAARRTVQATPPHAPPSGRAHPARTRFLRRGLALTTAQRDELWGHFDTRATKAEAPYIRAALLLFDAERTGVRAMLEAAARTAASRNGGAPRSTREDASVVDRIIAAALRKIRQAYTREDGEYHRAWLDRYRGLIGETMRASSGDMAGAIGVDFNLDNPKLEAAIRRRAATLADRVTETTAEQITAIMTAGQIAGMGISEIADTIESGVFGQSEVRATRIARTETIGALNEGELVAAIETGVMRSKEWLTQGDDRVRDTHAAIDGVRIDLGAAFANGCQYPGDPNAPPDETINCRCTLLFYDEEAPAGRASARASSHSIGAPAPRALAVPADAAPAAVSTVRVEVESPTARVPKDVQFTRDATGKIVGARITPLPLED